MSLAKKLAPLALAFSVAATSLAGPTTASATPSSNDNNTDSAMSFTCDMPDLSSLSIQDRIDNLLPASVLLSAGNSLGSGSIIDHSGYIITNAHVVGDSTTMEVTLYDEFALDNRGEVIQGTVLGVDPWMDLAIVKIDIESSLPCVNFGDSDRVRRGDDVIAIGNPNGQLFSVSKGVVSSTSRLASMLYNSIQSDTAVNPGNSGGGLFNQAGELIGINDRILSRTGAFSGISFAIPANSATEVADEIIKFGEPRRAILAVQLDELNQSNANRLKGTEGVGVLIKFVQPGSHAENIGLKADDIVLSIEGEAVNHPINLIRAITSLEPEDSARIRILRDGLVRTMDITFQPSESEVENDRVAALDAAPAAGMAP